MKKRKAKVEAAVRDMRVMAMREVKRRDGVGLCGLARREMEGLGGSSGFAIASVGGSGGCAQGSVWSCLYRRRS